MKKIFLTISKALTVSILFLKIHFVFGNNNTDSLPQFTIKIIPHTIWFDYDPHFEMAYEHFLGPKKSFQINLGYWNNSKTKAANTYDMKLIRLNYRSFFRKFSEKKPGRGYFNTELMYKNVIEPNSLMAMDINNPIPYYTKFKVNVLGLNFLVGREYVPKDYFPAFDIFFGLGVRASYNYNEYEPPGYYSSSGGLGIGMLARGLGFQIMPSINAGIGLGIGKWKK
ncbi:MAG: hypothetical protein IPH28_21620 [Cytophagaceae bacterium]|nr:hypothetical protein [Cytophagaceae bacterium]